MSKKIVKTCSTLGCKALDLFSLWIRVLDDRGEVNKKSGTMTSRVFGGTMNTYVILSKGRRAMTIERW